MRNKVSERCGLLSKPIILAWLRYGVKKCDARLNRRAGKERCSGKTQAGFINN